MSLKRSNDIWNSLPNEVKEIKHISTFKREMKKNISVEIYGFINSSPFLYLYSTSNYQGQDKLKFHKLN